MLESEGEELSNGPDSRDLGLQVIWHVTIDIVRLLQSLLVTCTPPKSRIF